MTTKNYSGDGIVVHWNSEACIHSGNCANGLPAVFKPDSRPWITTSAASAAEIAATIDTCPSGALSYTLTTAPATTTQGDSVSEQTSPAVSITASADGPLLVKGPVEIKDAQGNVVETVDRAALCRCGASESKPFCDGSHKRIGFVAP